MENTNLSSNSTENFGKKIKNILKENGYNYKVRCKLNSEKGVNGNVYSYEKVTIYAGRNITKIAQKRSRRLIAWKNARGKWEGDLEAAKQYGNDGFRVYSLDYHDKTEPLKYVVYSDLEWNDNEEYAKNKMLEVLKRWKEAEQQH